MHDWLCARHILTQEVTGSARAQAPQTEDTTLHGGPIPKLTVPVTHTQHRPVQATQEAQWGVPRAPTGSAQVHLPHTMTAGAGSSAAAAALAQVIKSHSKTVTDTLVGEHEHHIVGYSLIKGIGDGEPIASERFSVGGHEWVGPCVQSGHVLH